MTRFEGATNEPDLFGPDWAWRLERELEASETYRAAAASWKGSLAFVLEPDETRGFPERRAVYLDLVHGTARAVRPAMPRDLDIATFRVHGPAEVWQRLLAGDLEPGSALMGGGLELVRGSLFSLLPHLKAARALFECARQVTTS
jgi:putative sterol carrier protein